VKPGPRAARDDREQRERHSEPRDDERTEPDGFTRGFAATDDEVDADVSPAVQWMRGVQEDLEGDVFRSTEDLDAFFRDENNREQFEALKAEDPAMARRLEAALTGRGKALASRR
jgi:hypothetical protein